MSHLRLRDCARLTRWVGMWLAAGVVPLAGASLEITCEFTATPPRAVLVWLPDDTSWKPTAPTVIEQKDQTFLPVLAVAPPGGVVQFRNSDPQPHNVFALDPTAGIDCDLGVGDPGSTLSLTVAWPGGTVVKHGCKIHPQMQLWIASLSSAFHAVAEVPADPARVTLRLADIPITATRLSFWAPRCTPLTVPLNPDGIHPILRKDKPFGSLRVIHLP